MTRFKEMEEGETGYPMAREDRETVTEGGGGRGGPRGPRGLRVPAQVEGSGGPGKGPEHPAEKGGGGAGAFAAQREGPCGTRGEQGAEAGGVAYPLGRSEQ